MPPGTLTSLRSLLKYPFWVTFPNYPSKIFTDAISRHKPAKVSIPVELTLKSHESLHCRCHESREVPL